MSKKFLALSLLLAVPSVKPVVPAVIASLGSYIVPVATMVTSEAVQNMEESETKSCKSCTKSSDKMTKAQKAKEVATDVVVAECCAGTVACIDALNEGKGLAGINYKDVLKEGALMYCTVKLAKSELFNTALSKIPGFRLLATTKDKKESNETRAALKGGAKAAMVYAGLKTCAKLGYQLTMDFSKKYLTKTTV